MADLPYFNDVDEQLRIAWQARVAGEYPQAIKITDEIIGNSDYHFKHVARAHAIKGQIYRDQENLLAALEHYKKAVALYESVTEQQHVMIHTLRHQADLEREVLEHEAAGLHYEKVLAYYRQTDDRSLNHGNALRGYALLLEQTDKTAAAEAWSAAMEIYSVNGIQAGVEECRQHLRKQRQG